VILLQPIALVLSAGLLLTLVLIVALAVVLLRTLDRRHDFDRITHGQCLNCGYDLRGITGRCPECGKLISWRPRPMIAEARSD
jgi:hypothetical protein